MQRTLKRGSRVGTEPDADGGVAQLGEHLLCTQGVRSSNLLISTRGFPEEGKPGALGKERKHRRPLDGRIAQVVRAHA